MVAYPKPAKGSALLDRMERKRAIKSREDAEKRAVRLRDGGRCRWPHCSHKGIRLEVAHLNDKGIGGDHGIRSSRDQMILLCFLCHQGPQSLHQQNRKIEPVTSAGTNGPCAFFERIESGDWKHFYTERAR